MKVLDLQCTQSHGFEGWFGSEEDFASQLARGLLTCPLCGDTRITKKLSAPRLNLGHARAPDAPKQAPQTQATPQDVVATNDTHSALQAAWLGVARRILANTDDVGDRFAEEARKIHYGETAERAIRGQASREETESLIDEGIAVLPLPLPAALKGTLQ